MNRNQSFIYAILNLQRQYLTHTILLYVKHHLLRHCKILAKACGVYNHAGLHYLNKLIGMFHEDLSVFLHLPLIASLCGLHQHLEWHVGFQERVTHMIHHSFAKLQKEGIVTFQWLLSP